MDFFLTKIEDVFIVKDGTHDSPKYVNEENGFPLLTSKNLKTGILDFDNVDYISKSDYENINKRSKVDKGDLLLAMIGTIGNPVIVDVVPDFAIKNVALFKPHKQYNSLVYLRFYLKSNIAKLLLKRQSKGGTQKFVSLSSLRKLKIPLPSLPDQRRIAKVLSDAEQLIAQRKDSIALLDELLKSTFLDMFGDPVRNEKGWDIISMEEAVLDIKSGTSYGGDEKEKLEDDELGVLKISAVTKGVFNNNEFKAVNKDKISKKTIKVKKGMFLLSRANTRELVAACCIIPYDFNNLFIPDKLWSLIINENKTLSVFLNYLFKNENYRNLIRKKASGGHDSMLNISMKKFRSLSLPKPDYKIQTKFAKIAEKTEAIKKDYQESLLELENLYGSLSQRAFKGELDLSGVEIEEEIEYLSMAAESKVEYGL